MSGKKGFCCKGFVVMKKSLDSSLESKKCEKHRICEFLGFKPYFSLSKIKGTLLIPASITF